MTGVFLLFSFTKQWKVWGSIKRMNNYIERKKIYEVFWGFLMFIRFLLFWWHTLMPCIRDMALSGRKARSVRIVLNAWIPPAPSIDAVKFISDTWSSKQKTGEIKGKWNNPKRENTQDVQQGENNTSCKINTTKIKKHLNSNWHTLTGYHRNTMFGQFYYNIVTHTSGYALWHTSILRKYGAFG